MKSMHALQSLGDGCGGLQSAGTFIHDPWNRTNDYGCGAAGSYDGDGWVLPQLGDGHGAGAVGVLPTGDGPA